MSDEGGGGGGALVPRLILGLVSSQPALRLQTLASIETYLVYEPQELKPLALKRLSRSLVFSLVGGISSGSEWRLALSSLIAKIIRKSAGGAEEDEEEEDEEEEAVEGKGGDAAAGAEAKEEAEEADVGASVNGGLPFSFLELAVECVLEAHAKSKTSARSADAHRLQILEACLVLLKVGLSKQVIGDASAAEEEEGQQQQQQQQQQQLERTLSRWASSLMLVMGEQLGSIEEEKAHQVRGVRMISRWLHDSHNSSSSNIDSSASRSERKSGEKRRRLVLANKSVFDRDVMVSYIASCWLEDPSLAPSSSSSSSSSPSSAGGGGGGGVGGGVGSSSSSSGSNMFLSLALLLPYLSPQQYSAYKPRAIEGYMKRVLSAKTPSAISKCFLSTSLASFVASLNQEEWSNVPAVASSTESVEACILRVIKKSPESASFLVSSTLSHINPHTTSLAGLVAGGILPIVSRMLRSENVDARAGAHAILRAILSKSTIGGGAASASTFEVVGAVVRALTDLYTGKGAGGALSQMWQKTEVLAALVDASSCLFATLGNSSSSSGGGGGVTRDEASMLASEVLTMLTGSLDKENDSSMQIAFGRTIGLWMCVSVLNSTTNALPAPLVETLRAGLSKRASLAYLVAICCSLEGPPPSSSSSSSSSSLPTSCAVFSELTTSLLPLAPALFEKIRKPLASTSYPECVLALRCVFDLASTASSVCSALDEHKVWPLVADCKAYVYSNTLLSHKYMEKIEPVAASGGALLLGMDTARLVSCLCLRSACHLFSTIMANHPTHLLASFKSETAATKASAAAASSSSSSSSSSSAGGGAGGAGGEVTVAATAIEPLPLVEGPTNTLISCLLHPLAYVREAAGASVKRIIENQQQSAVKNDVSSLLVKKLYALLLFLSFQQETIKAVTALDFKGAVGGGAAGGDGGVLVAAVAAAADGDALHASSRLPSLPPPSRIAEALGKICLPPPVAGSSIGTLLLLCCHPYANGNSLARARVLTKRVLSAYGFEDAFAPLVEGHDALRDALISACLSNEQPTRTAAFVVLRLLSEQKTRNVVCPMNSKSRLFCIRALIPALVQAVSRQDLLVLSEEDIAAYLNPQAAIAKAVAAATNDSVVDVRIACRAARSGWWRRRWRLGAQWSW